MRTDLTSDIDAALSTRNLGARGFWEIARSGNGDMTTDLLADDGYDYEELEGLGEVIEEMTIEESVAEDNGNRSIFKPYRDARPSETPPYAPKPGKAWIRRRIKMETRRPGGNRLVRARWAQASPAKVRELRAKREFQENALAGMGFVDISAGNIRWAVGGMAVLAAAAFFMKRRRKPRVVTAV